MAKNTKQTKVGVDIGNTRTVTIVMSQDRETGDLTVLGYSNVAQNGMRKGMVVDINPIV